MSDQSKVQQHFGIAYSMDQLQNLQIRQYKTIGSTWYSVPRLLMHLCSASLCILLAGCQSSPLLEDATSEVEPALPTQTVKETVETNRDSVNSEEEPTDLHTEQTTGAAEVVDGHSSSSTLEPVIFKEASFDDATITTLMDAPFISNQDGYSIAVSYSQTESTYTGDAKRITFTANVGNDEGESVIIEEGDLLFIDSQTRKAYYPLTDSGSASPYLVGSTLATEEYIYGFVEFELPGSVTRGRLIWCPIDSIPCDVPIIAEIKELES